MMKPAGSPPGYVWVFLVVGSASVTSDECSARTCVILIWGPSGVTVPLLPKRMPCSALTQPRSIIVWMRPAGPNTLAPVRLARSTASHDPSVRRSSEVIGVAMGDQDHVDLAELVQVLEVLGRLRLFVRNGSIMITLPLGVVIFVVA